MNPISDDSVESLRGSGDPKATVRDLRGKIKYRFKAFPPKQRASMCLGVRFLS